MNETDIGIREVREREVREIRDDKLYKSGGEGKVSDTFYNILMKKSELFDIIKEQEQLMTRFNQLNLLKEEKIRELRILENSRG